MKTRHDAEEWFYGLYDLVVPSIRSREDVLDIDSNYKKPKAAPGAGLASVIDDPALLDFYGCVGFWRSHWRTKLNAPVRAEGGFDFIPIEQAMNDRWDTDLGGTAWAPEMLGFRPIDSFNDSNGFVGIYFGRDDRSGLYLVHSDSSVSPLHVTFDGYLQLLAMSKGFGWWQNALVEMSTGAAQPNVDGFREKMPLLFPDFDYAKFEALYGAVRTDR